MTSKLGCRAKIVIAMAGCKRAPKRVVGDSAYYCGCSGGKAMVLLSASRLSGRKPRCIKWYRKVVRAVIIFERNKIKEQNDFMVGWAQACAVGSGSNQEYNLALP